MTGQKKVISYARQLNDSLTNKKKTTILIIAQWTEAFT